MTSLLQLYCSPSRAIFLISSLELLVLLMSKRSKRTSNKESLSDEDDSSRTTQSKLSCGQWKEEDAAVMRFVGQYGTKRWSVMASNLPGRSKSGKQCRDRWRNQLDPSIKKEGWTDTEDLVVIKAHSEVTRCYGFFHFQFVL